MGLALETPPARAAQDCGAAAPGGVIACNATTYPAGVAYTGASGITVNIPSGTTVSNSSGNAAVDIEGTGAVTLNAGSATAAGSGTGASFQFNGPVFSNPAYFGVLGYSSTGPVSLATGSASVSNGGAAVGGYSDTGTVSITSTSATVAGGDGIGVDAEAGGDVSVVSGAISTPGAQASANGVTYFRKGIEAVSVTGNVAVNIGTISINGGDGDGIDAGTFASGKTTTITSANITTTGDGSYGMGVGGVGAVTVNSGAITVSGQGAVGINENGSAGDPVSLTITSGSITTKGDNSQGLSINNLTGAVTINSTTIATQGVNSDGADVTVGAGPATITSGTVTTAGAGSIGLNVVGGAGAVTIASNTVNTAGAGATGILVNTGASPVTVLAGSIATTGASADAVDIATAGAAHVTVNGAVTSAQASGLNMVASAASDITVSLGANLSGAQTAILAGGAAPYTFTNAGSVSGDVMFTGSGADTIDINAGSTITGRLIGGAGVNTVSLVGPGYGDAYGASEYNGPSGAVSFSGWDNINILNVASGTWTLHGGGYYDQLNVASGAVFDIDDTHAKTANGTPSDGGLGPLNSTLAIVNNGVINFNSTDTTLYYDPTAASAPASYSGSGSLNWIGIGKNFIAPNQTFGVPGGVSISNGSLVVLGALTATVTVNSGATLQIGGGGTIKNAAGNYTDTGLTGTVNGAIIDNGALVISRLDAYTFAGAFSGTGSLIDNDPNTVTFSGPYSFTGTTTVNGGGSVVISQLQSNANLNVSSGTLNVTGASSTITNLNVSSGTVNVTGSSATIANLIGTGGTVSVASGSTLTVGSGNFGGTLTGGGALTVAGTSAAPVILTGTDTLTGPTTVSSGALEVQGSLTSPVTVNAGASLGGAGTITGNVTVASGGVFSPGDPVTTNVTGAVTFASGSSYFAQVTAAGVSDLIAVTGTVTIQHGASVEVDPLGLATNYVRLSPAYTIITATGGVTGAFSGVTSDAALLTPHLTYSANAVQLYLTRNDISFASLAATPNQAHVAAAAQAAGFGDPVYNALVVQSAAGAQQGYTALSGEIYASLPTVLLNEQRSVSAGITTRLQNAGDADQGRASATGLFHPLQAASAQDGVAFWGQASTAGLHFSGTGGSAALQDDDNTVMFGTDMDVHGWRFGLAGGYGQGRIDQSALGSSATVDSTSAAIYAGGSLGVLNVKAGADYSWQRVAVERDIEFPGFTTGARGELKDETGEVFGQISVRLRYRAIEIEPYAGASYVHLNEPAIVENGGFAALAVSKTYRDVEFASLGLRLTAPYIFSSSTTITPYAAAGWRQALGDVGAKQTAAFTSSGQGFQITGTPIDRSNATVEMGVEVLSTDGLTLALGYQGAYGDRVDQTGVQIRASYRF